MSAVFCVLIAVSAALGGAKQQALNVATPPRALAVTAESTVVTSTVAGTARDRFTLVTSATGTVVITLQPIHGRTPKALLTDADGHTRHPDRRGMLWPRPTPGRALLLEISAPFADDPGSTYQLSVAFDVDRPADLRDHVRPARPRDTRRFHVSGADDVEQVLVGGLLAEHTVKNGDVIVTIPAFARSGPAEFRFEARAPERADVDIVGVETRGDINRGACAPPGCIALMVSASVGDLWLAAIARLVDADIQQHAIASGAVLLQLRMPSTQTEALAQLKTTEGVLSARAADISAAPAQP